MDSSDRWNGYKEDESYHGTFPSDDDYNTTMYGVPERSTIELGSWNTFDEVDENGGNWTLSFDSGRIG